MAAGQQRHTPDLAQVHAHRIIDADALDVQPVLQVGVLIEDGLTGVIRSAGDQLIARAEAGGCQRLLDLLQLIDIGFVAAGGEWIVGRSQIAQVRGAVAGWRGASP